MALTFSLVCDCGLRRRLTKAGYLACTDHCDRNACGGDCSRCATYKAAITARLSRVYRS